MSPACVQAPGHILPILRIRNGGRRGQVDVQGHTAEGLERARPLTELEADWKPTSLFSPRAAPCPRERWAGPLGLRAWALRSPSGQVAPAGTARLPGGPGKLRQGPAFLSVWWGEAPPLPVPATGREPQRPAARARVPSQRALTHHLEPHSAAFRGEYQQLHALDPTVIAVPQARGAGRGGWPLTQPRRGQQQQQGQPAIPGHGQGSRHQICSQLQPAEGGGPGLI